MSDDLAERSRPLEAVCERLLDKVADRADAHVTATSSRTGLTRFANSVIHQHVGEELTRLTLTVAAAGRVATAGTTRTDEEALDRLVENTVAAAAVRPVDPDWPGLAPPAPVPDVDHFDPATNRADPETRAQLVADFVAAGNRPSEDGRLRAAGYVDSDSQVVAFANSAGQRTVGRATRATVDGIHSTDTSAGAGHATSERLGDLDATAVGAVAAQLARDGANPVDLEPGRWEVVLGPECVATIAAFLAIYGFNAKQYQERQSFVRLGEDQFDRRISLWDDAGDDRALGVPFDAEGSPSQRVDLIDAGTTAELTHDRRTAQKAGRQSTGHALPGGAALGPVATHLFVGRGDKEFDELVAGVDRGVLVTRFHYCRILDPKTQVVTGLTRNGTFLIEGGEPTRALSNLRFTQSFVDALGPGNVRGVQTRTRFADTEFGPGMVVAPAMRLASWNVTGGAHG